MIRALKEKKKPILKIEDKRPQKAYKADLDIFDTIEEDEEEEIIYFIKEVASKLYFSSQLANIRALSHIINKINLFSNSLV